jgi:polysaccharide biosynthesis protein PslH
MNILWLKTELLHPVDKGGKIRTYHVLKGLCRRNHVTYLCLDDGSAAPDAVERAAEYCHRLVRVPFGTARRGSPRFLRELARNLVSPLPYAIARWQSPLLTRKLRELAAEADLVVCDFLAPSANVPPDLSRPAILFQHNVEALIWKRHADVARSPIRRAYMREQWRRMARFEAAETQRYDRVIAVSEVDRDMMRHNYGREDVAVVPTGVDLDFFAPDPGVERDAERVVFTGSMDWMPNQDGIDFFLDEVFPLVRRQVPGARLDVVGRSPSRRLVERAAAEPGLRVTGFVDDIRAWIQQAAVAVVPLRVGGGTRLKIYEAMAMATPVVSTTIGAEGLPLEPGRDIVIADEPAAMANALVRLLKDPGQARQLGVRAAELVHARFGWDAVADRFEALCQDVLADRSTTLTPMQVHT